MDKSVISLLIFALCIVLFVTEKLPIVVSSILGCTLMVIFNVAPFKTVFGEFASSSVFLCGSMMIVGRALFHTGITDIISTRILKLAGNDEKRLLVVSVTVAGIISAFMSNVGTLAMFMSIFSSFQNSDNKINLRQFMLPIAMATVIGGGCTLVGSGPQIAAQKLVEDYMGQGLSFYEYGKVGGIMLLALVLYVYFIGYPLGKKLWKEEAEEVKDKTIERAYTDKLHMYICAVIFVVMTVCLILEPLPIAVVAVTGALLCIITGCIDLDHAIKSISLRSIGQLAACLGLMEGLSYAGGADIIYGFILKVIDHCVSPFMLFLILIIVVFIMSEFMTNTVAVVLLLPLVYSLCEPLSLNPIAFTVGIVLASTAPMSTPLSCTPLTMVMEYGYRFKDYPKYALLYDAIALVIVLVFVPLIYGLTV